MIEFINGKQVFAGIRFSITLKLKNMSLNQSQVLSFPILPKMLGLTLSNMQ